MNNPFGSGKFEYRRGRMKSVMDGDGPNEVLIHNGLALRVAARHSGNTVCISRGFAMPDYSGDDDTLAQRVQNGELDEYDAVRLSPVMMDTLAAWWIERRQV